MKSSQTGEKTKKQNANVGLEGGSGPRNSPGEHQPYILHFVVENFIESRKMLVRIE